MKTRILSAAVLVLSFPGESVLAQTVINDRVAKAMPSKYTPPTCGLKAGHHGQINSSFGMSCSAQNSPMLGDQRKNMTRATQFFRRCFGIDQGMDSF